MDRYQDVLRELVESKTKGLAQAPRAVEEPPKVINGNWPTTYRPSRVGLDLSVDAPPASGVRVRPRYWAAGR